MPPFVMKELLGPISKHSRGSVQCLKICTIQSESGKLLYYLDQRPSVSAEEEVSHEFINIYNFSCFDQSINFYQIPDHVCTYYVYVVC
jgi:hypothetical protein